MNEPLLKASFNAYPVPIQNDGIVEFSVPTSGSVMVLLYSIDGTLVKELLNTRAEANTTYKASFNVSEVANGFYTCMFNTDSGSISRSVVIAK